MTQFTDALFLFGELALIVLCGYYAHEGIMRLWKSKVRVPTREWRDLVETTAKRCRLAASLEMDMKFNPDGAEALALLLERMADELDRRS